MAESIKHGRLFIIAAPSGGGKTSLVRALIKQLPNLKVSVSFTTRPPRPSDVEGVDYCFVSEERFKEMVAQHIFLEHAEVYGHHYGTSHAWVMDQLKAGADVILEIDWQGAEYIRKLFPDAVLIFILPPSYAILKQRLKDRRQDPPPVIAKRLREAEQDIVHGQHFDYLVVNDIFDNALHQLITIIKAERQGKPIKNLPRHEHLVQALLNAFLIET